MHEEQSQTMTILTLRRDPMTVQREFIYMAQYLGSLKFVLVGFYSVIIVVNPLLRDVISCL